ncbi:MAG: hypothetical protein FWG00_02910 [Coriobacteriia bacterium]|jgi:hypothetical protein|nr:hypothetical protein [Coriobacteriia bacterium]MDR2715060.1 hypothetical protein [Coriobacteriales bacterium]
MPDFFETILSGPGKYSIIFIAVAIVAWAIYMVFRSKKIKGDVQTFLSEHPDAAKAIIKGATTGTFTPLSINGAAPVLFSEGMKPAFYLVPGENIVEYEYAWARPGVMYKTVTTTVGPNKVSVEAEAGKSYNISYDKKAETCIFEEC